MGAFKIILCALSYFSYTVVKKKIPKIQKVKLFACVPFLAQKSTKFEMSNFVGLVIGGGALTAGFRNADILGILAICFACSSRALRLAAPLK